jgi:tRNA threonylcarbamoyladenosine biosynthesis protein TsaB
VLGLDTATAATTVAVWDTTTGTVVERRDDPPPGVRPRHTTRLLALAARALADAGTDWVGIDRIAVGVGPGTFTGIRIGVASARALAAARDIEIVGVSTLRALASRAGEDDGPRLAVLDARRGEAFAAGWGPGEARDVAAPPRLTPRAVAPAELARALADADGPWLAVGDGAVQFRSVLQAAGAVVAPDGSELHRVSAIEVCRLSLDLPGAVPDDIHPEYLRLPDAELARRAGRPGAGR